MFVISIESRLTIMHSERCSVTFMFAIAVVESCNIRIRKCIYDLMSRLSTSTI